jgi:hypothetical protein
VAAAVLGGKGAERTKVAGGVTAVEADEGVSGLKEAVQGVAADLVSPAGGVADLPKEVVRVERVAVVVLAGLLPEG